MCNKFSYINTAVLVVVSWEIGRSGCTTTSDIPIIMLNVVYLSIQPLHANVYKKCPTNYHTAAVFVVVSYYLVYRNRNIIHAPGVGPPVMYQYCPCPLLLTQCNLLHIQINLQEVHKKISLYSPSCWIEMTLLTGIELA